MTSSHVLQLRAACFSLHPSQPDAPPIHVWRAAVAAFDRAVLEWQMALPLPTVITMAPAVVKFEQRTPSARALAARTRVRDRWDAGLCPGCGNRVPEGIRRKYCRDSCRSLEQERRHLRQLA